MPNWYIMLKIGLWMLTFFMSSFISPSQKHLSTFSITSPQIKLHLLLIQENKRIYGADNAKIGWHYHPFADPRQHINCESMTFAAFLQAVEDYFDD